VHAVWELTLACDLRCRHCGSRAGRARPDELSLGEALDLVEQLADFGVQEVTLIGGEVYLYRGWRQVARAIAARGISCAMVSGGRGLSPSVARQAREAGVQSVSVSIDGLEATHDALRGVDGAYRAARAALENCRTVGLPVALNTQVNRENLAQLDALCDLLLVEGCHGWQLMMTVPAGQAADDAQLPLQPGDMVPLFSALERIAGRCAEAGVKFLPGNNIGYFGPLESRLRRQLRDSCDISCRAGRSTLGIESSGDIKGCPSLPTRGYAGANIRDHRLQAIWERSDALRFMRDRSVERLWGFCRSCYYAEACHGGCSWTATSLFGRPGNNPYCHHRVLELARRGLRERLLLRERAPGQAFDHGRWELVVEEMTESQESTCPKTP